MSVVIVGGNDRMKCQYVDICKNYRCKAKVFIKLPSDFKARIGSPDLVILFTSTVSHKMALSAVAEASRGGAKVVRCHSSSSSALTGILQQNCIAG